MAKRNVRAVGSLQTGSADGQTNQMGAAKVPDDLDLPSTVRLHEGSEESLKDLVCRRMLSVFRFTLAPGSHVVFVCWTARPCVLANILRNVARRFSVRFLVPSDARAAALYAAAGSLRKDAFVPYPVMIGTPAFKLVNSVGILSPLRLLA